MSPPDAERGPGKGPVQIPDDENRPQGTAHNPSVCMTCRGGTRRWTEDLRNEARSYAARAGHGQLEEVFC